MTLTKVMFASICLTDCLFKVIHHSQVMNLMNIIAYSLQIAELTPQVRVLLICYYNLLKEAPKLEQL